MPRYELILRIAFAVLIVLALLTHL